MSASDALKFRAFLSYSSKDSVTAKRVHVWLEAFKVDKDIAGRITTMGPIPTTLRPIFRDRHDFSAGGTLTSQTIEALDASAALVIIVSPDAAMSGPVNEEVRLFKWRHPDRPLPGAEHPCLESTSQAIRSRHHRTEPESIRMESACVSPEASPPT